MTDYLKTKAAFQGEKIFRAVTPAVNNVYKVLDSYLKDIRKKDWCRQEGEQAYEQRQNEFLTQISRKKGKLQKQITKDDALNTYLIQQKSYLLQTYRNEQLSNQRCNCVTVAQRGFKNDADPEKRFKNFADMCLKVKGCTRKVSFNTMISKMKKPNPNKPKKSNTKNVNFKEIIKKENFNKEIINKKSSNKEES